MRKHKSIDSFLQHYNKKYQQGGTFSRQQMFGIPYGYQDPTQEESGIYDTPPQQQRYLGDQYQPINQPQADFQGSPNIVSQSLDPGSDFNQTFNSLQQPKSDGSKMNKGAAAGMAAGAAAMKAVGGLFNGAISMIPSLQALIPEQEDERSIRPPERRAYNQFSQGQPGVYQDGGKVNPPIRTNDKSKIQRYNDSLTLYNNSKWLEDLKFDGSRTIGSGQPIYGGLDTASDILLDPDAEWNFYNRVNKSIYPISYLNEFYYTDGGRKYTTNDKRIALYKNPTQPYIQGESAIEPIPLNQSNGLPVNINPLQGSSIPVTMSERNPNFLRVWSGSKGDVDYEDTYNFDSDKELREYVKQRGNLLPTGSRDVVDVSEYIQNKRNRRYQDGGIIDNISGSGYKPYSTAPNSRFRVDYDWGSVAPVTEPIQQITPIQQPSVAFDNYVTNPLERVTQTTYDQSWNPINTVRIPQPQREVFVPNYSDNRYNIDQELSELYPSNQYLIGDAYQPAAPQRRNLLQRLFKAQEGAIIPDPTIILDDNGIPIEVPYITAESGIHIKPENRGKFTAKANSAGKGVQEYARQVLANKGNYPPSTVKQAQFARSSSKWNKAESGYTVGGEYELSQQEIDYLIQQGYELEY